LSLWYVLSPVSGFGPSSTSAITLMRKKVSTRQEADGYPSDIPYLRTFIRELAPAWLDHVALIQCWAPPDRRDGFAWCDLGCGLGVSAVILAATHPNGDFHGIDVMPEHVGAARHLATDAGISNVSFHEADFGSTEALKLPQFDYIVAHGVYSWISPAAQDSLRRFIDCHLKPGGLVYLSYNALPGRAADLPLQRLVRGLGERASGNSLLRLSAAMEHLDQLLALKVPALVASPLAMTHKKDPKRLALAYLAHEFLGSHWSPLTVMEVRAAMAKIGLQPVGSATLLENYDRFVLGKAAREILSSISDPDARELARDFLIDQFFRRDLFVRQGRRLSDRARRGRLRSSYFALAQPSGKVKYALATPAGRLHFDKPVARRIVAALAHRPGKLAEIIAPHEHDADDMLSSALLLVTTGALVPIEAEPVSTASLERAILRRLGGPEEILWLPLPYGTAVAPPRALLQLRRDGKAVAKRNLADWGNFLAAHGI
jgi:SAM-dependent methyltransferase